MTNAVALKKRMKGAELLTPKQRVFAEYFVSHYPKGTKKEAALHAGYSEKTCEKVGSLLTNPDKNPHVVAYIERLRDSASKQYKDHLIDCCQHLLYRHHYALETALKMLYHHSGKKKRLGYWSRNLDKLHREWILRSGDPNVCRFLWCAQKFIEL